MGDEGSGEFVNKGKFVMKIFFPIMLNEPLKNCKKKKKMILKKNDNWCNCETTINNFQ